MGILFGNLTIKEFSERSKVLFSAEDRKYLDEHREESAVSIPKNKFHIFDEPFLILCGSAEYAQELYGVLSQYDFSKSPKLHISIVE